MAIITATAVLNFAYPSGGGSSGDWQQPQDPCVVAGGPTVYGGQCSDAKQNGLSYDTLQRIVEEAVSGLRPTDATLTNDLTSGIFERLQELRQPVGDAESLAMLTRMLADVQTNGDDPATLESIREFLESGQTGLTGPLQTILDRLLSGDLDSALGELSDLIAELQASSGSPEEIARLEGLLRDGASRWDATFESLYEQLRQMRENGEEKARIAQVERSLENWLHSWEVEKDRYLTADQLTDTLRAELDRLRASMADPARITALEKRLDALTTNPSSAPGGTSGSGAASSTISVSIVRSLPCIVGFKRKKPSNIPDMRTLRIIAPGLIMAEVTASANFDYTFDFFGKGFSGFSGRIPEGSGKQKFTIDYSVGGGEIQINPSGTNLELASRQNLFVSAVASFKTRTGQDAMEVVRTDRQIEFVDETMPTAVKKKEEVFVEYEVYKIYPNWDTEKSGTDWYIDRKPIKIIYKVWLVFMDPNTGREAGGAGYEYRTEQFTVQPPTGNYKKEPNEKVGEDPGKLWE